MNASPIKKMLAILPADQSWVVGGAVRDRFLKRSTTDLDVIVPKNAHKFSTQLAQHYSTKSFVLDRERGVYRVVIPSHQIDIADFQGTRFEMDLDRRDFSVNALAIPLKSWDSSTWKKYVVDRHDGLTDLKKGVLRVVSRRVFDDDPLRLLRAFRISAELGFTIDLFTKKTITKKARLIKKPAPERIREEFMKLLSVQRAYPSVLLMERCGLLEPFFPEVKKLRATASGYYGQGGVLKHTLDSLNQLENVFCSLSSWFPRVAGKIQTYLNELVSGFPRRAHLKWAVLLHDVGKPATAQFIQGRMRFFEHEHVGAHMVSRMKDRYRWSNEEAERYTKLVRHHMRPGNLAVHPEASEKAFHRFFRDLGDDAVGMLLVSLGDHLSYLTSAQRKKRSSAHEHVTIKMMNKIFLEKEKVLPPRIINGYDILRAFNLKPSPIIGTMLNDVLEAQAEGRIKNRVQALSFLKNRLDTYLSDAPEPPSR